jgi:MFS family permease
VTTSVAVLGLGVGSSLPLCALALTARGLGPDVVGWIGAAAAAGGILSTLISPRATLRFGRRIMMLIAVTVAAGSVISLQYVDSLWGWTLLRAAFGAAMAPLFVIGEAWITSLPADAVRGRVVAIYTTSFTLCQLLGPLLTDVVAAFPTRAFVICGGVFLLGLPGIAIARDARVVTSAGELPDAKDSASSWLTILRIAPAIIAGAALFAAFDNVILSFLPLFALDHGATRTRALSSLVVVFVGDATLQFAAGWLADRFGHARMQRLCAGSLCILLPVLPWMLRWPGLWEIYLLLLGGVAGAVYTLSIVSSGERFTGAALLRVSGLIALTWSLAASIGSAATGILMQSFGSAAITSVLTVMAFALLLATRVEQTVAA